MKKVNNKKIADDLWPEYDLAKPKGGVRGKYARRFQQGTNLILLSLIYEDCKIIFRLN